MPVDSAAYHIGDTVAAMGNTLIKTYYSFSGWNAEADGNGSSFEAGDTFAMGSSDINLYAKWTANLYTISFKSYGGSSVRSITQKYSTTISDPISTKEGYTFAGWYNEYDATNKVSFPYMFPF